MKTGFLILLLSVSLISCRFSHQEKLKEIHKSCKDCDYIKYGNLDIAIDTISKPNKIYEVSFNSAIELTSMEKIY